MPIQATAKTLPESAAGDESPSEKVVRESRPRKQVTDSRNRNITYRTMSILDQAKLYRAIGSPHTSNEPYMRLLNIAAMVVNIDGDLGPQPTSVSFAEMRMDWLGDEGFAAIVTDINRDLDELAEMDDKAKARKFQDDVKN